jgi:DNA-directed RNA polymerase specialized sigma24 family protein
MEDDELLRRLARQKDEEAFRALYARHSAPVYGLLCHLAGRSSDASELLHETWLRAVRHLSLFHGQCTFSTWLAGIALNCYRDRRRRHGRPAGAAPPLLPGPPATDDPLLPEEELKLAGEHEPIPPRRGEDDRLVATLRRRGLLRRRWFWSQSG